MTPEKTAREAVDESIVDGGSSREGSPGTYEPPVLTYLGNVHSLLAGASGPAADSKVQPTNHQPP